jgi:hypothetical protein
MNKSMAGNRIQVCDCRAICCGKVRQRLCGVLGGCAGRFLSMTECASRGDIDNAMELLVNRVTHSESDGAVVRC